MQIHSTEGVAEPHCKQQGESQWEDFSLPLDQTLDTHVHSHHSLEGSRLAESWNVTLWFLRDKSHAKWEWQKNNKNIFVFPLEEALTRELESANHLGHLFYFSAMKVLRCIIQVHFLAQWSQIRDYKNSIVTQQQRSNTGASTVLRYLVLLPLNNMFRSTWHYHYAQPQYCSLDSAKKPTEHIKVCFPDLNKFRLHFGMDS